MKNVKKLLAEGKKDILPDERVKRDLMAGLGVAPAEESVPVSVFGGVAAAVKRKSFIIALCAAALALIIALCIMLPALFGRPSLPGTGLIDGKFDDITDSHSFYAYGAASVGAVIASVQDGASASSAAAASRGVGAESAASVKAVAAYSPAAQISIRRSQELTQEEMDTVNRYMALVENLLGEGSVSGSDIAGGMGYPFGMTISYKDLLGSTVTYTMYYDKIFIDGERDEDEEESNYSVEGVLVVGDENYPVEGRYSEETEEDESERSLYFKAYTGENSYIEVHRESEDEEDESETEYVYNIFLEGELYESMSVSYESEEEELELEMRITRGEIRETLVFSDESEDGERIIAVRGDIDGTEVAFKIYIRHGSYRYVFSDGSSSDFDRFDGDDEDDEDDDDGPRRGRLV